MYGGPYEVWGRWGVADDVLCPGQEKTFEFLEDVLDEVVGLFPSELIHIGGDECPKVRWEQCPRCQARIRQLGLSDKDGYTAEHYLQGYVTDRIGKYLAERGRRIIGWDEILEGQAPSDAIVMSWRGSAGGIKAAKLGHDVIMTPQFAFLFRLLPVARRRCRTLRDRGLRDHRQSLFVRPDGRSDTRTAGAYPRRAGKPLDGVHRF